VLFSNKIVGTIIVVLSLTVIFTTKFPIGKNIRENAVQIFRPGLEVSNITLSFFSNFREFLRSNENLKEENYAMKNTIEILQREITRLREFESENNRLRSLIELKQKVPFDTLPAQIIGRDLTGWAQVIIIDKGSSNGVKEDMPVVAAQGIVGKVIETGLFSSKVQLLIDKKSQIGGIMQKSRIVGLVEGTGSEYLTMNYLPRDEEIYVNDLVLSSGLGKVYEKGLIIGTVKEVHEAKFGLYKYAVVSPSVPFSKMEEILVILNMKKGFDEK